jgi:hypothetical protein
MVFLKSTICDHVTKTVKSCERGPETVFSEHEEKKPSSILTDLIKRRTPARLADARNAAF